MIALPFEHIRSSGAARAIALLALLGLLAPLQGCTFILWSNLTIQNVYDPRIIGVASEERPGAASRQQYLIVSYYNSRIYFIAPHPFYCCYAIPLQNEHPPAPLEYRGPERTQEAILKSLSEKERREISGYRFSGAARRRGELLRHSSSFIAANTSQTGVFCTQLMRLAAAPVGIQRDKPTSVMIAPYWWEGGKTKATAEAKMQGEVETIDPRSTILLLPYRQKRSVMERAGGIALATASTPITLAGDMVVIPVFLLGFILTYERV